MYVCKRERECVCVCVRENVCIENIDVIMIAIEMIFFNCSQYICVYTYTHTHNTINAYIKLDN